MTFTTRSKRAAVSICVLATVAALTLTACGDDDEGPSAATPSPTLEGDPIKIMAIDDATTPGDTDEQSFVGAEAGAKTINDAGGIDGRPIQIIRCDTKQDANIAADCARTAVKDEVIAVIQLGAFGDTIMPILEPAGIPSVANALVSPMELSSELSFPIMGGFFPFVAGAATIIADQGGEKINFAIADVGGLADAASAFAGMGLQARGLTLNGTTPIPPGAADFSTQAAAALGDGTDGVALATDPQDTPRLVKALREADEDVMIASNTQSMRADGIGVLGDAAEGVLLVSSFRPITDGSPEMKTFVSNMDAIDDSAVKGDLAINDYLGVQLIASVLDGAASIDSASLVAGLNEVDGLDLVLAPPIQFQTPKELIPDATRLFSTQLTYLQIEDGKAVQITDGFVDPFTAPAG